MTTTVPSMGALTHVMRTRHAPSVGKGGHSMVLLNYVFIVSSSQQERDLECKAGYLAYFI
jgi:hypothetical protein